MKNIIIFITVLSLNIFTKSAYAAEFTNQDNPYIRAETEEDLLIGGLEEWEEDDFEYGLQSMSDYYAVVGNNNEYVYYYHYQFNPKATLDQIGLYLNSNTNTAVYHIPFPHVGLFQSLISKSGKSVCLISEQVIDWNADPEAVILTMFADGEEQWHVCLKDLGFQQTDYELVYGEYEKWYGSLEFDSSQIIITSSKNQKRCCIDRTTGKIIGIDTKNAKNKMLFYVGILCVFCFMISALFLLLRKRKKQQRTVP